MTIDLKIFSGMLEPKKGSLEKNKNLPVYAGSVRAKNKSAAQVMLHGIFMQFAPELADDYFKPKVWEDREGVPRPELMGVFTPEFFSDEIIWNAEAGEPERVLAEPENAGDSEQHKDETPAEKMTLVKPLPTDYRAASLVMFGPVEEITATQYGHVIELVNDEFSTFEREMAEAIARETRVMELLPERQGELLAHLRETAKETSQWTDIKKLIIKWLDTPPAQREQSSKSGGDKLTIDDHKQRSIQLRYHVATGVIARSMDFDVLSPPIGIEVRANSILSDKNDTEVTDWFVPFSRTPGVYDFSPVAIVAMIKTARENLSVYPGEVRKYIDNCISAFDCVNPSQLIIDIACGRTCAPLPQKTGEETTSDKTEQTLSGETELPAVCPARAAELDRELNAAFANGAPAERDEDLRHKTSLMLAQQRGECIPELGDDPTDPKWDSMAGAAPSDCVPNERSQEIKTEILSCVSGQTNYMGKSVAGNILLQNGLDRNSFCALLIDDLCDLDNIAQLSDDEIHQLTATSLRNWHLVEADDRGTGLVRLLDLLRSATGGDSASNQEETASNEGEKTEAAEREDNRLPMDAREIEIAHALNDVLSGRTNQLSVDESAGDVVRSGHVVSDLLFLLMEDMAVTECCLSPDLSDDEIHLVASIILEDWSDDKFTRQKIALDAIVEYRLPEIPDRPVITAKPKKEPEPTPAPTAEPMALTYLQQLTLAALQGMCANPAYRGDFDELPHMAAALAAGVVSAEANNA